MTSPPGTDERAEMATSGHEDPAPSATPGTITGRRAVLRSAGFVGLSGLLAACQLTVSYTHLTLPTNREV